MSVRTLLRCAVLLAGTLLLSSDSRGQGDLELATYYYNTGEQRDAADPEEREGLAAVVVFDGRSHARRYP